MSIDISDVRAVRRNALQNIRRAMYREGYAFSVSQDLFPTGKGMSQPELSALYDYYESFYGHVNAEDALGGFKYTPKDDFDYSYEDFTDYDYTDYYEEEEYKPHVSYVQQARERIADLDFPPALAQFNEIVANAEDLSNTSIVEKFFDLNMDVFDSCYKDVKYYVDTKDEYGERSTAYFVEKCLNGLKNTLYRWCSSYES